MITQAAQELTRHDRVIIARKCTETPFPHLGCIRGTATHQPQPRTHRTTDHPAAPVRALAPTTPTGGRP